MKVALITRTNRLLQDLRRDIEARGHQVTRAHVHEGDSACPMPAAPIDADVLIFEASRSQPAIDFESIQALTAAQPMLAVIVLCADQDAQLLRAAMHAGVREVLHCPPPSADLDAALVLVAMRKPADATPAHRARTAAFISCKGGSGATFLATNVAHLVATEYGLKTALIDTDLQYGDATYFVTDGPGKSDLGELAGQTDRLDAQLLSASMVQVGPDFSLLPAPEEPEAALGITAAQVQRVIEVAQSAHAVLILDVGRVMEPVAIKALDKADLVYLVTVNMIPYVRSAKRLVRTLRSLGYDDAKLRLVVNRFERNGVIDLSQLEKAVGLKAAHVIPESASDVAEAVNMGVPLSQIHPSSPVTRAMRAIAEDLTGRHALGARGWMNRLIGDRA